MLGVSQPALLPPPSSRLKVDAVIFAEEATSGIPEDVTQSSKLSGQFSCVLPILRV